MARRVDLGDPGAGIGRGDRHATTTALVAAIGVLPVRETTFQPLDPGSTQADEVPRR
jgi:hypothetical protein